MTSLLKYPLPSESKTLNAYQNSNHKFNGEEKEKEKEKEMEKELEWAVWWRKMVEICTKVMEK